MGEMAAVDVKEMLSYLIQEKFVGEAKRLTNEVLADLSSNKWQKQKKSDGGNGRLSVQLMAELERRGQTEHVQHVQVALDGLDGCQLTVKVESAKSSNESPVPMCPKPVRPQPVRPEAEGGDCSLVFDHAINDVTQMLQQGDMRKRKACTECNRLGEELKTVRIVCDSYISDVHENELEISRLQAENAKLKRDIEELGEERGGLDGDHSTSWRSLAAEKRLPECLKGTIPLQDSSDSENDDGVLMKCLNKVVRQKEASEGGGNGSDTPECELSDEDLYVFSENELDYEE